MGWLLLQSGILLLLTRPPPSVLNAARAEHLQQPHSRPAPRSSTATSCREQRWPAEREGSSEQLSGDERRQRAATKQGSEQRQRNEREHANRQPGGMGF